MIKSISPIPAILALLFFICPPVYCDQPRPLNDHEEFYHYVAYELNEPDLCEKISLQAFISTEKERYRAECYYDVATRFGRKELCKKVTPIYIRQDSVWVGPLDQSPQGCIKKISEGVNNIGFALSEKQIIALFSEMGYKPETLYLEGITPQIERIDLSGAYSMLGKKNDILERIRKVTGPQNKQPNDAVPIGQVEFLYDLAAHVSNDVSWCMKIRDEIPSPPSKYTAAGKDHFRDTCIFQIASNTRDKTLCGKIPDRPEYLNASYHPPDLLSVRQNCYRQIDGEIKYPNNMRYSYLIPSDEKSIVSMINLLGYPLPDIKDVPSWEVGSAYSSFILELAYQPKLKNSPARQKFIENVRKLPSYE